MAHLKKLLKDFVSYVGSVHGHGHKVGDEKVCSINGLDDRPFLKKRLQQSLGEWIQGYLCSDGPQICCCFKSSEKGESVAVRVGWENEHRCHSYHADTKEELVDMIVEHFEELLFEKEEEDPTICRASICPMDFSKYWH